MTFDSITNRGEFFSNHYLDAIIDGDLRDLRRQWDDAEAAHKDTARSRIRGLAGAFFAARAVASEAGPTSRPDAVRTLNGHVLEALGFTVRRHTIELTHTTTDELHVPVAATVETGTGLLLVALDADLAGDVDDLFDTKPDADGQLFEPVDKIGEKLTMRNPADAVSEIFATDDPPRWAVVIAGRIVLLAERGKWSEGRFLAVDLDTALERNDRKKGGELETIAALFSTDALVPDAGQAVIDELTDKSHKHAVGVSKELREGIRQSIEVLADEVINRRLDANLAVYSGPNRVDPRDLTRQCLRFLYRMLVLLYAESRPELGIVPVNDEVYLAGYSLDRLRELVLVDLDTDEARTGTHLDASLRSLFELVNRGYHAEHAQTAFQFDLDAIEPDESYEDYLQFPGLDAQLFESASTPLLDSVTLRNEPLQKVLQLLMLSREGRGRNADRGFISYAQLGINQLGAVYEGLMAYTGFFTDTDLYEVAKGGDPSDGTWVVSVDQADEYPDDVFVSRIHPLTGREERILHRRGSFVFRLSGRDRQRSASYYTPEVLTRCVVKHALAELLGTDHYAPEHGSSGITEARQILDLTICEPALGSGAFLNEAINQLSAEYLRRRQAELGVTLDPEQYNRELQKVKAHFALHQSYGIDLNATAVELAEVSLWLNCMHPGLKAPWFGLQLRRGNSLIGCRRATWRVEQLKSRPWTETRKEKLEPPVDRPLTESLAASEIHHFLLPAHGWAAVADRKEAKEFRPDEAKVLRDWRKTILKAPMPADAERLRALAAGIERLWLAAAKRIEVAQRSLRRPIEVWGSEPIADHEPVSRHKAMQALHNPDSDLGRLRTVMDAWVGLWFWALDTDVAPPTWSQWLAAVEDLVQPDVSVGTTGQLDLLEDLPALLEADEQLDEGRLTVAELRSKYRWLEAALEYADREGAWHWELEFAHEFRKGGFNLQVGNPPWVRPRWYEDLVLAEVDPWWGVAERPSVRSKSARRTAALAVAATKEKYLAELASSEGVNELIGSPVLRPVLSGIQTNLYMVFMDTVWRNGLQTGTSALLHPESHFTDPKGATLRATAYRHLRRHWQFVNELFLFEDIHHMNTFGVHVYGRSRKPRFLQMSAIFQPSVVDESLRHSGSGEPPGIQYEDGGWDLRPHSARVLQIDEGVLSDWARLFDDVGTPPTEARLLRPVTQADLEALSVLADQPVRLADHEYSWTRGHEEDRAKQEGIIEWDTRVPDSWEDVVLQGPHFTTATPFAKQPNENCRHNQDYSEWDLEALPRQVVPRTNYQRATDRETYTANIDHWNGKACNSYWRVMYRAMTQPGLERSLHAALIPPGPMHVNAVHALGFETLEEAVDFGLLWATLPYDYLVKVIAKSNIQDTAVTRSPFPEHSNAAGAARLRYLRLSCLTTAYAWLWEQMYQASWQGDTWTSGVATVRLGRVQREWTTATPLRRDVDRRQALVELDVLTAIMLGLNAEQLCAMYRTQFPVLRKYEYSTVFDAEGRKICKHHQSAGFRQSRLQDRAKSGDLPKAWEKIWYLYEQWVADPESVDWLGYYHPPFYCPDREAEMRIAYTEFQRRPNAIE